VLTYARGSSDHAATFAKYLIETRLGIITASQAPSVASVYAAPQRAGSALCLAISQSGRSPDILAAVEAAKQSGAYSLALVNAEDSPLAALADTLLPLLAGPELSVAATKSYIAALAAMVDLVAAWSQDGQLSEALDDAPAQLERAWQADWTPLTDRLREVRGLYVVGRGLGLGIAQEAALKFKETCGLHAEAFSAAEVRHGPMALAGPGFPFVVFRQSDETEASIEALVADVLERGGEVFLAGPPVPGAIALPSEAAHPVIEPMLQIQSFYRAVNALSLARGLDPDAPPHLSKVTETI
jgi:glucosamine--fructose-6-phosphate aminotransferase (isomerizing)